MGVRCRQGWSVVLLHPSPFAPSHIITPPPAMAKTSPAQELVFLFLLFSFEIQQELRTRRCLEQCLSCFVHAKPSVAFLSFLFRFLHWAMSEKQFAFLRRSIVNRSARLRRVQRVSLTWRHSETRASKPSSRKRSTCSNVFEYDTRFSI